MKLFSLLLLPYVLTSVLAGGVQGGFERVALWYLYQAENLYLATEDAKATNYQRYVVRGNDQIGGRYFTYREFIATINGVDLAKIKEELTSPDPNNLNQAASDLVRADGFSKDKNPVRVHVPARYEKFDRIIAESTGYASLMKNIGITIGDLVHRANRGEQANTNNAQVTAQYQKVKEVADTVNQALEKAVTVRIYHIEKDRLSEIKKDPTIGSKIGVTKSQVLSVFSSGFNTKSFDRIDLVQTERNGVTPKQVTDWYRNWINLDQETGKPRRGHQVAASYIMNAITSGGISTAGFHCSG